jgi:hypothetical protein
MRGLSEEVRGEWYTHSDSRCEKIANRLDPSFDISHPYRKPCAKHQVFSRGLQSIPSVCYAVMISSVNSVERSLRVTMVVSLSRLLNE